MDVTLVTLDGKELPMPSHFDDFSEKAHLHYTGCSQEQIDNRDFLQKIMIKHGFSGHSTEWWHFDLVDWQQYPLIETAQENGLYG